MTSGLQYLMRGFYGENTLWILDPANQTEDCLVKEDENHIQTETQIVVTGNSNETSDNVVMTQEMGVANVNPSTQ